MRDREIDEILKKTAAAQIQQALDAALLKRVSDFIQPAMLPVRPLPRTWVLAGGLVLGCALVALAGALRAGFGGLQKMDLLERTLVFSSLGILAWLAATQFVNEMIPGSKRRLSPAALIATATLGLLAVFALLFRDYHSDHFVAAGFICLITGVLHAIPAALLSWWLLRHGFAVSFVSAGMVAGALAGLAGVGLLELHCPNLQAAHILVWHTAVLLVSTALGGFLGLALRYRASKAI